MCTKSKSSQPLPEPVKYAQQKTPVRRDATDAQSRAKQQRLKATKTLLANDNSAPEDTKKTLLGGGYGKTG